MLSNKYAYYRHHVTCNVKFCGFFQKDGEEADRSLLSTSIAQKDLSSTSLLPLMTSAVLDEDNPDSILEEHCSRIDLGELRGSDPKPLPWATLAAQRGSQVARSQPQQKSIPAKLAFTQTDTQETAGFLLVV